jgi:hypothetical protein
VPARCMLLCPRATHHELHAAHCQVPQDVAHAGVLAAVVRQPQRPVGINSV